jgi:cytochrome c oxidase cbb3-type subunit 3
MSDKDRLIEHEYDGIMEYDNPMPTWWVVMFWATIIFSIFYAFNIGVGSGEGRIAQYEADMADWAREHPIETPTASAEELLALADDPAMIAEGKAVFDKSCVACHAADGGGGIGPNLTDAAWLHGASIDQIHDVIRDGVLEKGMPEWGRTLTADEVASVTAYVWTLRGTTPAAPKAPEGEPAQQ